MGNMLKLIYMNKCNFSVPHDSLTSLFNAILWNSPSEFDYNKYLKWNTKYIYEAICQAICVEPTCIQAILPIFKSIVEKTISKKKTECLKIF